MKIAVLLLASGLLALAVFLALCLGETRAAPADVEPPVVAAARAVVALPEDPRAGRRTVDGVRALTRPQERIAAAPEPEPGQEAVLRDAPVRRLDRTLIQGWYDNGQLDYRGHQMEVEDGRWVLEGPWEAWHENGTLDEFGAYENDGEVGVWHWWHDNGVKLALGAFVDGKRNGEWTYWFEDGKLQAKSSYANGKAHGPWTTYHANGALGGQGSFLAGKLSGPWSVWYPDGTLNHAGTGIYVDGVKVRD